MNFKTATTDSVDHLERRTGQPHENEIVFAGPNCKRYRVGEPVRVTDEGGASRLIHTRSIARPGVQEILVQQPAHFDHVGHSWFRSICSAEAVQGLLAFAQGRAFTVEFVKRTTGQYRTLNAIPARAEERAEQPGDLVLVKAPHAGGYRSFGAESVHALRYNGYRLERRGLARFVVTAARNLSRAAWYEMGECGTLGLGVLNEGVDVSARTHLNENRR